MEIKTVSYSELASFTSARPWAAISIASFPRNLPPVSNLNRVDILQLIFTSTYRESLKEGIKSEYAFKIIEFTSNVIDKVDLLIVQCKLGQHRSPAVAAAITKLFIGDNAYWFEQYPGLNVIVYKTIILQSII